MKTVVIKTNKGNIKAEIFEEQAPITAGNFLSLVKNKFYDGLKFHRVVSDFVVQGGDPRGDGTGGSANTIKLEISPELKHDSEGILAMARSAHPDSASSQFYITLSPQPHLDGAYAVFGKVIEGMDVVKNIKMGDIMEEVYIE